MIQIPMPKKVKKKPPVSDPLRTGINAAPEPLFALKALILENGSCPIEEWIKDIRDVQTKQRIQSRLDRIERGNMGDCHPVGEGVSEFRLDIGPGFRIYYALAGSTVIILIGGGKKSTQSDDVETAKRLWKDYRDGTQRHDRDIRR